MNDWIGKSLGKVRIDSLLARGGMAEVYLGTHTTLKREVAVKILRTQYEDDPDLLERFEREAQVVAKLRHHNIVQVFDFDSVDDRPYIVMEYVPGPSLSQYLAALHKNNLKVEVSDIVKILTGVANALQYAHESGVIHRDIKPGNIILTSRQRRITPGETLPRDFEAVLTDFGLVRFLNSSRQTSAGQTAGTPAYMSPEQARGDTTDSRTDIYSLGVVLYEMLAGKVPFDGETTVSILLKHISNPLPPIPDLAYPIQKVLEKALAKIPAERYQTAVKLANAFKTATETKAEQSTFAEMTPVTDLSAIPYTDPAKSPIVVEAPKSLVPTTVSTLRRNWVPVTVGAAALALFGVIYMLNGFAFRPREVTATPSLQPTPTFTEVPVIPISGTLNTLNSTAILHHRNGDAILDQTFLEAFALKPPPAGTQYEVVLNGPEGSLNTGVLILNEGKGTRTYNATTGENLLAKYDQVQLIAKPTDANSKTAAQVMYSYTFPPDGLVYIRQLLVSDPDTPNQVALIRGLSNETQLLEHAVSQMQEAFVNNDQADVRMNAESIFNLIVGSQSPEHKDWDGNRQVADPGTGYGFLQNGNNLGHIQAIFSHADYVANSAGASQNMIERGSEVKTCAENLALWLPQLSEQAQKIVNATSLAETERPIQEAVNLVKNIRDGADINGNSKVELIAGECGVVDLGNSAYAMADMPLLPINGLGTQTPTGTTSPVGSFSNFTATPKPSGGNGSGNTPVPPNNNTGGGNNNPPGQNKTREPKPPKTPKP